jgi:hypothetical protein
MKTFVSTKMVSVMDLLSRQIATLRSQEGLASQSAPFGGLVLVVFFHSLDEYVRQESRDA